MSGAPASNRPRPSRSCSRCQRRKVKCDQARPKCSRCVQGSFECEYESSNRQRNLPLTFIDETSSVAADYASLHRRVNRLDEMLTGIGGYTHEDPIGSAMAIGEQELNNGHLYLGPQSKSRYVSPDFFAMISQEARLISIPSDETVSDHSQVTEINHLLQQQQQYALDPNLFVLPSQREEGLGAFSRRTSVGTNETSSRSKTMAGQLCGDIFPLPPAWTSEDSMSRSTARIHGPGEVLEDMPSKQQCEALIWAYLEGYHTISLLFHGPSFLQQARKYIDGAGALNNDVDLHFLALLRAVLFAGCAVSSRKRLNEIFGGQIRENLSSRFYQRAVQAIRLTNFPQTPSIHTLAAFIIVDTIYLREEQPLTCCSFVGLATRVSQMLGLHKDPASFPELSLVEIQVRRQLWWSLVALDVQVALSAGLPPIIDCSRCQVHHFSEYPEDLSHLGIPPPGQSKSVAGVLVSGKVYFYRKASKILYIIHSNRFSREDLDDILKLIHDIKLELNSRIREISELELTLSSPRHMMDGQDEMATLRESQSNPVLAEFAKAVLSLLSAKPYAIIQGPVMRQQLESYLLEKDPLAISGCRKYLHGFLKITQSSSFQPWHWRWPGQHQPLHSIMALITYLSHTPDSPLARETRKLVDLAIYMCGPQENNGILSIEDGYFDARPLSMAGSKAWELIRRTRERVWTKAGLDPVILNCPERAEDIHLDGEGELMEHTPAMVDVGQMMEAPMLEMGGLSGLGDDWLSADVDGIFDFDPSLFFTGEI